MVPLLTRTTQPALAVQHSTGYRTTSNTNKQLCYSGQSSLPYNLNNRLLVFQAQSKTSGQQKVDLSSMKVQKRKATKLQATEINETNAQANKQAKNGKSKQLQIPEEVEQIINALKEVSSAEYAKRVSMYFKTGPGEYAHGDIFVGARVPDIRKIAINYKDVDLQSVKALMDSEIHEQRILGVLILVQKYNETESKKQIVDFYLEQPGVNNWDIVDLSAYKILGNYLLLNPGFKSILDTLSDSDSLWKRRIAIVCTYAFIGDNQYDDIIKLATKLKGDEQDLIQKALGWMLREVGKRNISTLRKWLDGNASASGKVLVRYAIEKMDAKERKKYLNKQSQGAE